MREQKGFGVCAIRSGSEVGRAANCHDIGTLATVQDFDRGEDGLLAVVAKGERRFRLIHRRVEHNQLLRATVEWLDDCDDAALPEEHKTMAAFLEQLIKRAGAPYTEMETHFESCDWVASRLTELLPFALADKQRLLEMDVALDRLDVLYGELLAEELSHHR
jgi:Lon protease-like protein